MYFLGQGKLKWPKEVTYGIDAAVALLLFTSYLTNLGNLIKLEMQDPVLHRATHRNWVRYLSNTRGNQSRMCGKGLGLFLLTHSNPSHTILMKLHILGPYMVKKDSIKVFLIVKSFRENCPKIPLKVGRKKVRLHQ